MSGRIRHIEDFGAVQLPTFGVFVPYQNADNSSLSARIGRFERLLEESGKGSLIGAGKPVAYEEMTVEVDEQTSSCDFISGLAEFRARKQLSIFNEEIAFRIQSGLLCGCHLKVFEKDDCLNFEFSTEMFETFSWISDHSERLAEDIAKNLGRDVRIVVRDGNKSRVCIESKEKSHRKSI